MMGASGARGTYPAIAPPRKPRKPRKPVDPVAKIRRQAMCIMRATPADCDDFVRAYVEAALWSTNDETTPQGGEPLDKNYGIENIDPRTLWGMIRDCNVFRAQNAGYIDALRPEHSDEEIGADFWFNRNGHGRGFWDGDYPEPYATQLDEASKRFGEVYLFCGPRRPYAIDDGMYSPCIEHEDCTLSHDLGFACLVRRHQEGGQ